MSSNFPTYRPHVFWLFGLSGAGKTTLASLLAGNLRARGIPVLSLDGDALRSGLCRGLGFTEAERTENLRRAAEVARLGLASRLSVVASFITPLETQRHLITHLIEPNSLALIWINASLEVCRQRDVKGLYAKDTKFLTGVSAPFEQPVSAPALEIRTDIQDVLRSSEALVRFAVRTIGA